jgi:hypothetical protein
MPVEPGKQFHGKLHKAVATLFVGHEPIPPQKAQVDLEVPINYSYMNTYDIWYGKAYGAFVQDLIDPKARWRWDVIEYKATPRPSGNPKAPHKLLIKIRSTSRLDEYHGVNMCILIEFYAYSHSQLSQMRTKAKKLAEAQKENG